MLILHQLQTLFFYSLTPQHFLYFFPLPQGHGSFLPTFWLALFIGSFLTAESP
jgi:hypothetical protein